MDGWSVGLLVGAGYVAVMGLVRLMLARRNQLMRELRNKLPPKSAANRLPTSSKSKRPNRRPRNPFAVLSARSQLFQAGPSIKGASAPLNTDCDD